MKKEEKPEAEKVDILANFRVLSMKKSRIRLDYLSRKARIDRAAKEKEAENEGH